MADIDEKLSVTRPVNGFLTVRVVLKAGITTSSYSYKTTQSGIKVAVELCRREAYKNLDLAMNVSTEGDGNGPVVPHLHSV